jgi:hypothetical protein
VLNSLVRVKSDQNGSLPLGRSEFTVHLCILVHTTQNNTSVTSQMLSSRGAGELMSLAP